MISLKIGGIILAAFAAGAFIASPELRVYAANTVGSADIINESIQSVDIKNGEVKAADIGSGAVGSSEIAADAVGSSEITANAVGASEIAADAVGVNEIAANSVGASELAGVSKLRFTSCAKTNNNPGGPSSAFFVQCDVSSAQTGDKVVVTKNAGSPCWAVSAANISTSGKVDITSINVCTVAIAPGATTYSIIVYDPEIIILPPP